MKNITDLDLIKSLKVGSIEDAEVALNSFGNEMHTVSFHECCIDDDLNLCTGNEKFKNSFDGLRSISNVLRIPFTFSERIPSDLFIENANRLFKENKEKNLTFFLSNQNNYIVDSMIAKNRNEFNEYSLLDVFRNSDFKISNSSYVTENRIIVKSFIDIPTLNVEPKVGDLTQFGTSINYNWLIRKNPKIELYSHTLACTNGAIYKSPNRFRSDKNFRLQLQEFIRNSANIAQKLGQSSQTLIPYDKFVDYYRVIKNTLDIDMANRIFMTNYDDIKEMNKQVRTLKKMENYEMPHTNKNFYDIFYNATFEANKQNLDKSDFLQKFSGNMIINEIQ